MDQAQGAQVQRQHNVQPQRAQPLQPQNVQPQRAQPLQPQNVQPLQPQNVQPQRAQPLQPQNVQPQRAQPMQAQNVQSYQPQNVQPQRAQLLQPQNVQPLQPQRAQPMQAQMGYGGGAQVMSLQPQNAQPQRAQPVSPQLQPQNARPLSYNAGVQSYQDPYASADAQALLADDLAVLGISGDLAGDTDQKMEMYGFSKLPNDPLPYDEDGQTAETFKIGGSTLTQVGEVHEIILRPMAGGAPAEIKNPTKYIGVILTHESGAPITCYYRDNGDRTYSLGFVSDEAGNVNMIIQLCHQTIFELNISVTPGGEEKKWMVRFTAPIINRPWSIDVMRTDGDRPQGKHPFEVETEGGLTELSIQDLGGIYQVVCTPIALGPVKVFVRLFGNHIVGSPLITTVIDPRVEYQKQLMMEQQRASSLIGSNMDPYATRDLSSQQQPQRVMQAQPQPQRAMQAQPQRATPLQPANMPSSQPQPQRAVTLQPANANVGANAGAPRPVSLQPQNAGARASTYGQTTNTDDALSDLLNELDSYT
eukprot:TRINITY_DN747_c0_g1_i3.p1 TRINITY_DN747_c0_g1~~TRINITY_DN747_c0_g1_i3.p1  ORF type:complete len:532 (-),score=163.18 TRINITY_DN747_c0_g1_i3:541-2136(-)